MQTQQQEIALRIECAAALDWRQMCDAAPPEIVQMTGLKTRRFGEAFTVLMPLERQYPINGTSGVGILEPATEILIDELIAFFRGAGCDFGIGVNPASQPENLAQWLLERSFAAGGRLPILYRSAANPPPFATEYRIERIGPERAALWESIFARMYVPYLGKWQAAMTGWEGRFHYLVYDGETPIAVSQMSATNGVAFPHFSGVLPEYRGRGIQRALIARRIQDAADFGCEWLSSTADEDRPDAPDYSMRNLRAAGFETLHYTQGYDFKLEPSAPI